METATTSADQATGASVGSAAPAPAAAARAAAPTPDVVEAFSGRAPVGSAPATVEPQQQRALQPPPPRAKTVTDAAGQGAIAGRVAGATIVPQRADSSRLPLTAADSLAELRRRAMMSAPMRLQEIVVTSAAQDSTAGRALRAERSQQANVVIGAEAAPVVPFVARPGVEMAGCYSVMIGNWSGAGGARAAAVVPTLLRLEATTLDIALEGPRLVLRSAMDTAALRPDSSYWRVNAADSLLVVWRGSLPEVMLRLQIRDPLLQGTARQGDLTAPVTARRVGAVCGAREQDER
jgi:hypothetical protein